MDALAESLYEGFTQVIDADLSKYFDSIPHAKLMTAVAERIADGAVLALIAQWLKAPRRLSVKRQAAVYAWKAAAKGSARARRRAA